MVNTKLKVGNVPNLRFPGFEGEWVKKRLGEIGETYSGLSGKTKEDFGTGKPYIQYKQVFDNPKIDPSRFDYVQINETENQNRVKYGDILFTTSSETAEEIGMSSVLLDEIDELYLNSFCFGYRLYSIQILNPAFGQFLFRSNGFRSIVKIMAQGSTRYNLSKNQLMKSKISFPSIEEQRKISDFLSLIDEKILSQIKIIEELKLLKHTLIKKLFSYQLKFNDDNGNNFFEWRDIMLGDIGQVITGKTPSTKDLDLWDGDVQFVTPTDMNESKYQYSSKRTIKRTENLKILPPKSIMFTCIASIGKMSLSLKPCVTNQQINSIIPNSGFNNEFIFYAVANISEFIKSIQSSSTMPIINKTEFSKFKISVPSLKEQTKIADFLTSIDKKINIEIKVAQKLEDQKSFLLQQLFI